MATPTAEETDWGVGGVAAALEQLTADLSRLHVLLPELNLLDKCAALVLRHMQMEFMRCREHISAGDV